MSSSDDGVLSNKTRMDVDDNELSRYDDQLIISSMYLITNYTKSQYEMM